MERIFELLKEYKVIDDDRRIMCRGIDLVMEN